MTDNIRKQLIEQLTKTLHLYDAARKKSKHDDLSDLQNRDIVMPLTRAITAIERIGGKESQYYSQAERIFANTSYAGFKLISILGIVEALKGDIEDGYLETYKELIHGELFGNFLDMANHLLEEGYKDPAAVLAGGTLEEHLRQLCIKSNITFTDKTKASKMNDDLAKAQAYSQLDHKNVTAWLDLRNKAAHSKYNEYTRDQVALLISGIRDFLTRVPS